LEALRKYHNRAIETAQVIEELIAIAKDMQADLVHPSSTLQAVTYCFQ
jgi:type I restriction enzyme R subunit